MEEFIQEAPILSNQFISNDLLRKYLQRTLPPEMFEEIKPDLENFGERVVTDILDMGKDAEQNHPILNNFDVWGNRVDKIIESAGWTSLKSVSAEEGLVSIGYQRKYGQYSRVYQFAKLFLFTPSSAIYTCPLAMTDGAARIIEIYGDDDLRGEIFPRFTTRDPKDFFTSGQWMTEKSGGSDLSHAETIARFEDGIWRLSGPKWFASAITADTAMTLARIEDENGEVIPGSRGLSLFYLKLKNRTGGYNNIEIDGLKDKLGTKALPTGELRLMGSDAKLIGDPGNGVKKIATMLNVTRLYNSISAISYMSRALAIAKDYSTIRKAFGKKLSELPLHQNTLVEAKVSYQGSFVLAFYLVELQGKLECNVIEENESKTLRLLISVTKLFTAKEAIALTSELLESMGGVGYLEDFDMARIYRDVQVLSIWEGTTNVLSLDAIRAITREDVLEPYIETMNLILDKIKSAELSELVDQLFRQLHDLKEFWLIIADQSRDEIERNARSFAFSIARLTVGILLTSHADWCMQILGSNKDVIIAKRWCRQVLVNTNLANQEEMEKILHFG